MMLEVRKLIDSIWGLCGDKPYVLDLEHGVIPVVPPKKNRCEL